MIRIVVFLLLVALLAFGAAWVADRPGEVAITWQGWRMETSVTVAAVALVAVIVLAVLFWTFIRFILRSPDLISFFLRERRRARGWRAISNGLIAIGTGNLALASRSAADAKKLAGDEPLTLLLAAQAAQLEGASERAEAEFKVMLGRPETRLLGLRGLYVEARRRNDLGTARAVAEEAERDNPALSWASEAQIEFQCLAGNWAGALETVERAGRARAIDKATLKRRRAVLLTALALANEEKDPAKARADAVEAAKFAPDLVPAAALAGRLLGAEGKHWRGGRIVEAAWKASPHPDLAEVYMDLRPGDSARDRLKRAKKFAKKSPGHIEGALAVARAALDATDFDQARMALAPFAGGPDPARVFAHGRDRSQRARRSRQGARMERARDARPTRRGLGRRRLRVGTLVAGLTGERKTRRVRLGRAVTRQNAGARTDGHYGPLDAAHEGGFGAARARTGCCRGSGGTADRPATHAHRARGRRAHRSRAAVARRSRPRARY